MITFQHVSFSYDSHRMQAKTHRAEGLRDIGFTVKDGECVLLHGRSGYGETTMTHLVNRLIPNVYPDELTGDVLPDGRSLSELPMYEIASLVGSVSRGPEAQFLDVDTDNEITFGVENQALPREQTAQEVTAAARILEIETLHGGNIFSLSDEEKQRVASASVYAMNPTVYLLDESSSDLNMKTVDALKTYLKELKSQGRTILIAEHRLYYLMDIVDRTLILDEGQITRNYSAEEFLTLISRERRMMGLRTTNLRKELPELIARKEQENSLESKNVSLFCRKETVMRNISAKFLRGKVVALVGKNGTGKTTLSRTPCGLHQEIKGDFFQGGKIISTKRQQKISYMVMQDANFQLFAESVEAECSFGIHNPNAALIAETIDTLNLTSFAGQHPGTPSGGQKQGLAVAMGQIRRKELIVFDEPTNGLDYENMTSVAKITRTLSEQGKIIFVMTHDYEFLCRTCNRIPAFSDGEINDDSRF